jgi:hypothetical protein
MGVKDCFEVKEREEGKGRVTIRLFNKRLGRKMKGSRLYNEHRK